MTVKSTLWNASQKILNGLFLVPDAMGVGSDNLFHSGT